MSADVLIYHCTLRIARRGGWSWGADPRGLLKGVIRRLPELIAMRVSELWPADVEREIAAPLRLHVSLSLEELLALVGHPTGSAAPGDASEGTLGQRIDQVLRDWVARAAGSVATDEPTIATISAPTLPPASDVQTLWAGSVLAVLLGWHRQGSLPTQLLSFSPVSLASWHDTLLQAPSQLGTTCDASVREASLAMALQIAATHLPLPAGGVAGLLIRRISFVVAAAHEFGVSPGDVLLTEAMRAHRAFDMPSTDARSIAVDDVAALEPAREASALRSEHLAAHEHRRPSVRTATSASVHARLQFDVKVASALPFLLLGPLSRTGYLLAVSAVFESADLLSALPSFAVALARKVLAPPQRGWFRNADAVTAAVAFAGLHEPPADAEIAEHACRIAPHVSPLDTVVAKVLTDGHAKGRPLVLQSAPLNGEQGWMVCEEEGLFAIAWADRIERLFARLVALGGELLIVPESVHANEALESLDNAGFHFVTDVSPARGQSWRALHHGSLQAWSNVREASSAPQLRAAERLALAGADSAALWRSLALERPGVRSANAPGLERSLTLAAALALGTIAWTLWRERESVTPLLALQRFSDLDARVSYRSDTVQVHLPLGRRFLDLKQAGLLADIPDAPWLGGRVLRFAQG